jgi:aryl-alcohol dehydrogenase
VYGAGAVGLAAIMAAARLTPATKVIAIDIVDSRLEMAKELGATHVINSKSQDVIEQIHAITKGEGTDRALDSTGDVRVIEVMIQAAASGSSVASVGANPGAEVVQIRPVTWLAKNVHYTGTCGGSASPHSVGLIACCLQNITHSDQFIPALIELWQEGRFPIDRLLTKYPFADIHQALADIHSGKTIKAVITWE